LKLCSVFAAREELARAAALVSWQKVRRFMSGD